MHHIFVSKDRSKKLSKGQNYAIDLDLDLQNLPSVITRQLAALTYELTENSCLTQIHAESLLRRFSDLLGDVRVLMSDHTGSVSRQYHFK